MQCHHTPTKIAKIQRQILLNVGKGYAATGTFTHFGGGGQCKRLQFQENLFHFLKKGDKYLAHHPVIQKTMSPQKNLPKIGHCSFMHNNSKKDTTYVSSQRRIDKKKPRYISTARFCSAIKRKELRRYMCPWMNLKNHVLSERSLTQQNTDSKTERARA